MNFLKGKRTYLAGIGIVLGSAGAYLTGQMDAGAAIVSGIQGLAFIFLRGAIPTSK